MGEGVEAIAVSGVGDCNATAGFEIVSGFGRAEEGIGGRWTLIASGLDEALSPRLDWMGGGVEALIASGFGGTGDDTGGCWAVMGLVIMAPDEFLTTSLG